MRPSSLLPCLRTRPWIGSFTSLAGEGGLMYHVRLLAYYQKLRIKQKRYPEHFRNTFLRLSIALQSRPRASCLFNPGVTVTLLYLTLPFPTTSAKLHLGLQGHPELIYLNLPKVRRIAINRAIIQAYIPVVMSGGGRAFRVPRNKTMSLDHQHSYDATVATDYC